MQYFKGKLECHSGTSTFYMYHKNFDINCEKVIDQESFLMEGTSPSNIEIHK